MKQTVKWSGVTVIALAGAAAAFAQTEAKPTADSGAAPPPSTEKPKIVVHTGAAPSNAADARVNIGTMRISTPAWTAPASSSQQSPADPAAPAPQASPARSDGTIETPANTLGPGEALWQINERRDAERKLAEAQADHARALADRAAVHDNDRWHGYSRHRTYLVGGLYNGGRRRDGLRGPVTTTITYPDTLGSTAQRAYADAAYPRLNGTQDARDAAVRQFGRDATPPIIRIQNDIDRAHSKANKEH